VIFISIFDLDKDMAKVPDKKKQPGEKMELKYSKILNRERRIVEMMLYGELGDDSAKGEINGHYFARELNWLAKEYDEIKIRINSNGGSVTHGLSIVSEMMASTAFIHVHIDGIAASMAAVLLPAADRVTMNDYAKIMIHSPYYVDENGEAVKNLSAKDKKSLAMLKDTLKTLLSKRGMNEDTINTTMRTDTWFTADEAQTGNLVDEVVVTGKKRELAALEPLKLVAKINSEHNFKNMKKVIAKLNTIGVQLAEDATEDQVVVALDSLPKGEAKPAEKLVNQLIAVGKKTGVITDGDGGNEAKFRKLAETDLDLFVDMLNIDKLVTAPAPKATARVSEILEKAAAAKTAVAAGDEKTFGWYEKNDPRALARMEAVEPEKFAKLKAADDAKYES
jgi:ATP-dependent Clp endopeptidase proteolytic subunit ClpP